MNMASQITQYEWATIDHMEAKRVWDSIFWELVESKVNKLQSRIAKYLFLPIQRSVLSSLSCMN